MLDNRINNLVYKINICLLSLIFAFAPAYVFAADTPEDIWLREITKNVDSTGRTTGYTIDASKRTIVNGSARDMSSKLLDYKPQRSAVSGVMKKRLAQAAVGGGVVIIGAAAVDALLRGIGWIMEDGAYVKKRTPNNPVDPNDPSVEYLYYRDPGTNGKYYSTPEAACMEVAKYYGQTFISYDTLCRMKRSTGTADQWSLDKKKNINYDPNAPKNPNEQKIPITDSELEDIMFGDYQGDPDSNIQPKNDGQHTGVQETMTADPNAGEGTKDKPSNPVTEDIDQNLDANPNKTTKDYNSTDTKGTEETTKADGTKEQTNTDTRTELPAFCNYAASLCAWMDWTQKDENQTDQEIQKEELNISAQPDTTRVNFGSNCPAPLQGSYSMLGRSFSVSYSWDPACEVASNFKPAVVGCAGLAAIYIVLGINRKTED